jgi:transposase-like protein
MMINIANIIDPQKCYEEIRKVRWKDGVICLNCESNEVKKSGFNFQNKHQQHYKCKVCKKKFDDLTETVFSKHNLSAPKMVIFLYFLGLNLSNNQIAKELNLKQSTAQNIATTLRGKILENKPKAKIEDKAEIDEVYVISGHKGNSDAVKAKNREPRVRRLKGARGRGTAENDKVPIVGIIQRNGNLIIKMFPNVQQVTIKPFITENIEKETLIYTDEYNIYSRLLEWGYEHKTVCHSKGEYARDEDGDGFHEVHTNTIEGVWSLLRSWLRPHRGISQEHLPSYIGFFEFTHNVRKRGKNLLDSLMKVLLN